MVHARFKVEHATGSGQVVVWFQDRHGQMLRDTDGRFRTRSDHVAMGATYKARGAVTRLTDFRMTLPAGQIHLGPGKHSLAAVMGLFHGGRYLAKTKPTPFVYTLRERPRRPTTQAVAGVWLKRVWVQRVTVGGKGHVKLLVDLTTDHLKGKPVHLQGRFYFTDGRVLKDYDRRYRSSEGHALVARKFVPLYKQQITIKKVWITHRAKRGPKLSLLVKARLGLRGYSNTKLLYSLGRASYAQKLVPDSPQGAGVAIIWYFLFAH